MKREPIPGSTTTSLRNGMLSREAFFDPSIYKQELEKVFARVWLFLGHESQIPDSGDFVTVYMGEDPVILSRDSSGKVGAFLNSCRHRGMKVCRTDSGNARHFRCSFHGWTYASDGRLAGVPFYKEAYGEGLDFPSLGLIAVPKVESYGGLLFGCWDAGATSLDQYLGDFRWYLDILIERSLGGLEFVGGSQRYHLQANWKIASENFAGDSYHLHHSHGSMFKLDIQQLNPVSFNSGNPQYSVACSHGHGMTSLSLAEERFRTDLTIAEKMGHEVVDYVRASHARLEQRLSAAQTGIYALGFGNIFPNLSFNDFSALRPTGIYLWQPKGAGSFEAWQWCAVDKDAPASVKEMSRIMFSRMQAATGITAQDDTESFEQVTQATRGVIGRRQDFHYQMGIGQDGQEEESVVPGIPGRVGNYYSELGQRNFYRYWSELMESPA